MSGPIPSFCPSQDSEQQRWSAYWISRRKGVSSLERAWTKTYKNNVQRNTEVYNCLSSDHIWPSFLQLLPLAEKISSSNFCVATQFDFRGYHEWMMNCGGWAWFTEALGEESLFHQSTCRWLSRSQARCGSTKATDVWSDMEVGQLIPNLKFYSCQAWEEQENFEFQLPQLLCQSTNRSSEKYLNVSLGWQMKCEWHESWTWKIIVLHCLWSHTHGYHGLNEIFVGISWKVSMPHTVQAYSLLDPAPTYGNTNFSDLSNSVNTWNWEVEVDFFFSHRFGMNHFWIEIWMFDAVCSFEFDCLGNWTSFLLQQGRPVVFYPETCHVVDVKPRLVAHVCEHVDPLFASD